MKKRSSRTKKEIDGRVFYALMVGNLNDFDDKALMRHWELHKDYIMSLFDDPDFARKERDRRDHVLFKMGCTRVLGWQHVKPSKKPWAWHKFENEGN